MKILQLYTLNSIAGKLVYETSNEIIKKADDTILTVELKGTSELLLNGLKEKYQLDDLYEINKQLLLRSGFIQVHSNYLVNSHCITRLFTNENKIELLHRFFVPYAFEYEINIKYFLSKVNLK